LEQFELEAPASHSRGLVQCGVESFTCSVEVFKHGAGMLKGHRPAADDGEMTSWCNVAAKQRPGQ